MLVCMGHPPLGRVGTPAHSPTRGLAWQVLEGMGRAIETNLYALFKVRVNVGGEGAG